MKSRISAAAMSTLLSGSLLTLSAALPARAQDTRPRYSSASRGDTWTVPENSIISVRMNTSLSSKTARVGDKFTGTVDVPVYVNGETVIPAGATVEGRVTQVTPAKRMNRSGSLGIDFDQIVFPDGSSVRVVGSLTSADPYTRRRIDDEGGVAAESGKNPVVFIGGSGALGAILGGITGGAKGAAVGGAIGAGAGIASVLLSKGAEAEVPAGTPFGIQLRQPLIVRAPHSVDPGTATARSQYPRDYDRPTRSSAPAADRWPSDPTPAYDDRGSDTTIPDSRSSTSPGRDNNAIGGEPANYPPATRDPEPLTSLSSAEAVRRAQVTLKEQGYYEGAADGVMSPRIENALKVYQRDHKLPESGQLDQATARSLGILGSSPNVSGQPNASRTSAPASGPSPRSVGTSRTTDNVAPANVIGATAHRQPDGAIVVSIDTQANTGGWRWFAEQAVNGNSLEVFARGIRPTGMVTQVLTRGRIEVTVKDGVESVEQVVVHSSGADRVISLTGASRTGGGSSAGISTNAGDVSPNSLQRQAEDLFAEYQRISGIRLTQAGSVEVDNNSRSGEPEIELLFALDSFVRNAELYARLVPSLREPARVRQATVALARQARVTDRVISTSQSQIAKQLTDGWESIRLAVLSLMQEKGISTSEIEP